MIGFANEFRMRFFAALNAFLTIHLGGLVSDWMASNRTSFQLDNLAIEFTILLNTFRRVLPTVEPGYLRPLIPETAPVKPESWQDVMADIERVIMPGVTHWHSPRFHAYFPTANSYPAIVADMLSGAIACIGFTWVILLKHCLRRDLDSWIFFF